MVWAMYRIDIDEWLLMHRQQELTIVTDYDRTITDDRLVLYQPAIDALKKLKERGVKILIASGRQLNFLAEQLGRIGLFDAFVAENGAILHFPYFEITVSLGGDTSRIKAIFRNSSFEVEEGEVLISVKRAFEEEVKKMIRDAGIKAELHFNRDSIMVLPEGVNKAVGVKEALTKLGLLNVALVCIGDAENDVPLFEMADLRVATENALPEVKERADVVCKGSSGLGVARFLIDMEAGMARLAGGVK